jgi:CRISPR-associated endonuclease/helicase Cas3
MPAHTAQLLAHSAPSEDREPQSYAEHILNVRCGARERTQALLHFAVDPPPGFLDAIDTAATFHDLGKIDEAIQNALFRGRKAKLPWDHIDAGVAHVSSGGNWMAAWLIRAHHAPGLPCRSLHFNTDGLGRKLRGRRNDDCETEQHGSQQARTDKFLPAYLSAHEHAVGPTTLNPVGCRHGLPMRLALSCLVDADHTDAARFDTGRGALQPVSSRWRERLARLDDYVRALGSGTEARDRHRSEFYRACRDTLLNEPMAACEGPVGLGKTTAVTAHLLRRAEQENLRHLIIVAPYTNIISQTVRVLRNALALPGEEATEVVLEHHHRADFQDIGGRDLAVLWRAPVIVTTAVQLFETLASNRPAQLRKLHELPGSAIYLDEAHAALPTHLWPQNWRWLQELAERWRCRIVFASGSLARFWENRDIVGNPVRLPELLTPELGTSVFAAEGDRVRYRRLKDGPIESIEELAGRVAETRGPRLLILNTVQSAAAVARELRTAGFDVLHLSTALCPNDRDRVLDRVQRRLVFRNYSDWTLVATSCVEAGVDLSFRTAFRERFSTASLLQVGGRVNRHGEFTSQGGGTVWDFVIDTGNFITRRPAAELPARVLKRQLDSGAFDRAEATPAQLVTTAMAEELRERGGIAHDALSSEEKARNYPEVAAKGRVIDSDTRLVVIDPELRKRIEEREAIGFHDLLRRSVQIWANRIRDLRLPNLSNSQELYAWPYAYDPEFLGYMKGVLELADFIDQGGAII